MPYADSVAENCYRLTVRMVNIGKGASILIAAANSHRHTGEAGLALPSWVPGWRTMPQRRVSSILMEEGFDVRIMHGKLLKFFGRICRVYTSSPTADMTGSAYVTPPSPSLRLFKKGDVLSCLTTPIGNQDSNCAVLRPSDKSEHLSLISGVLVLFDSMNGTSLVDGTARTREFLVK